MTEELEGQMSIADCFGPDIWSGKTCREHYLRPENETEKITEARISKPSSRKSSGSSRQMLPMFLYLKTGDGLTQDVSWELERTDSRFPLLTEYTIRSFGECPSVENVSLLSQILEDSPLPKYSLSARACAGILRRAEKRGKKLPELLEETLKRQSASKSEPDAMGGQGILIQNERTGALSTLNNQSVCYGFCSLNSNSMKSSNPHSGIYEADTSRTLDLNGGSPACNQGGMAILYEAYQHHGYRKGEAVNPLTRDQNESIRGDTPLIVAPAYIYDEEQAQTLVAKGSGGVLATNQAIGEYKITGVASSIKQRDYKDATDLVISQTTGESVNNGK